MTQFYRLVSVSFLILILHCVNDELEKNNKLLHTNNLVLYHSIDILIH